MKIFEVNATGKTTGYPIGENRRPFIGRFLVFDVDDANDAIRAVREEYDLPPDTVLAVDPSYTIPQVICVGQNGAYIIRQAKNPTTIRMR